MVGWGLVGQGEEEEEDRVPALQRWAHYAVSAPPPSLWSRPRRYQVSTTTPVSGSKRTFRSTDTVRRSGQ